MRRGASTVVVLVGEVVADVLSELGRSPNLTLLASEGKGLDEAVQALSSASRRMAPYVVVTADPLQELADEWHRMWDVGVAVGTAAFEEQAGRLLEAWRSGRFELPDYYVVLAPEHQTPGTPHPNDLHVGVLGSERPSRVVPVPAQTMAQGGAALRSALGSLPSGPWWPPLDRIVASARSFFPERVATAAPSPRSLEGGLLLG